MSSKKERLQALIAGERVVPPVTSFFGHLHEVEHDPQAMVDHLMARADRFGWDFIKVQSRASYYMEAWGCVYRQDPVDGPILSEHVIREFADYRKLGPCDVREGPFGEHVRVASMLAERVGGRVPCVHTVFSPLTVLSRLRGAQALSPDETDQIRKDIETGADAVRHALDIVTTTLTAYVRALVRAGADGIFLTNTVWGGAHLSAAQYREWAEPFDRRVLEAARDEGAWFNIMHTCRANTHFDIAANYPVQMLSFDDVSSANPSLAEAASRTGAVLWSGLSVQAFAKGDTEVLRRQIEAAWSSTGGRRFAFGPTCGLPADLDDGLLKYVADTIRELT